MPVETGKMASESLDLIMDSCRQPFGPSAKTRAFWPPSSFDVVIHPVCSELLSVMSISLNLRLSSWLGCSQTAMSRFLFMLGPELTDTALSPVS